MDKNSELYIVAKKYRRAKRARKKMTVMSTIFLSVSFLLFVTSIILFSLKDVEAVSTAKYGALACGILLLIVGGIFLAILIKAVSNIKSILKLYKEKDLAPVIQQIDKEISDKKDAELRAKSEREAHLYAFNPGYKNIGSSASSSSSKKASGGSFGTVDGYYKDGVGITREVGEDFVDGKGIYRRAGESYFDGKGELRNAGEDFYDARGELRSPGERFYDD